MIAQRLPATLQLALLGFLLAIAIAVPLGVTMGVLTRRGHGRRTELAFTTSSTVVGIIPDFLIGVGLVYVFGVSLGWLPVAGNDTPSAYVLPVHRAGDRAGRDPVPDHPGRDGRRARGRLHPHRAGQADPGPLRSTSATPCRTR